MFHFQSTETVFTVLSHTRVFLMHSKLMPGRSCCVYYILSSLHPGPLPPIPHCEQAFEYNQKLINEFSSK